MGKGPRGAGHATVVAYLALIIAVGTGGAYAASKIGAKDIKKNAVRSKHIKNGQVKSADANLVRYAHRAGTVAEGRLTPNLAVRAKRGDLLVIHGRIDIQDLGGSQPCSVYADVRRGASPFDSGPVASSSTSFDQVYLSPGGGTNAGALYARPITVPIVDPGRYVVFLTGIPVFDATCEYRDRNLWIGLLR